MRSFQVLIKGINRIRSYNLVKSLRNESLYEHDYLRLNDNNKNRLSVSD